MVPGLHDEATGIALLATVGFAAMAQAADLPTTKALAPAAKSTAGQGSGTG